jgi:NDP-sugar pyrophosphorylase family protein
MPSSTPSGDSPLKLSACLLLAGGLKPSPLVAQTGGSVLDLYLRPSITVMGHWFDRFQELAAHTASVIKIHVVHGATTPPPSDAEAKRRGIDIRVEEDRQQYRGPAGAVRDACAGYRADETVLVAEAARYVSCDLTQMMAEHAASGAEVTVASNPDSSPAGVFLIRCRTLQLVPSIGFMDLKEQWLGKAVEGGINVRVHRLKDAYSYELRTREDFLAAARVVGGLVCTTSHPTKDVEQGGNSAGLVHSLDGGASLGLGAVVVDSVIMPGAQIGDGAVVARSIVCPSGVVAPRASVVDAVVPPSVLTGVGKSKQEIRG